MYLSIFIVHFLSIFFLTFFGKTLTTTEVKFISILHSGISFFFAILIFYEVALCQSPVELRLFSWINFPDYCISWGFYFDTLSAVMLIVITSISFLVHIYSAEYMKDDPQFPKFYIYLSLFTVCMIILVSANNLLVLFFGWEGVGLCSYLLINFWHTRIQANKAAIKAMLVNRIGDTGLALGMFLCLAYFGTLEFTQIFTILNFFNDIYIPIFGFKIPLLELIAFCFTIGAMGKSAQFGLHTWLPDAMEGPTPVSALIHAATMVTAGIFLILRCSMLFENTNFVLTFITIIGGITCLFAAMVATAQMDLKRIIAYSTCSQLGYMMFACGISAYHASIFHLFNHAFFKALLFLTAGAVIHALSDEQDIRRMGGLFHLLPLSYATMLIGSLSLMGFPFLSGYYSKDLILELSYASGTTKGLFVFWLGSCAAACTGYYSFRLIYLTFLTTTNVSSKKLLENVHEAPILMAIPLIILSFASIFSGYFTRDMMVGLGTHFWNNSLYIRYDHNYILDVEFIPTHMKLVPLIFTFLGTFYSFCIFDVFAEENFEKEILSKNFFIQLLASHYKTTIALNFFKFLNRKGYIDFIINNLILNLLFPSLDNTIYKKIEKGLIEYVGSRGLYLNLTNLQKQIQFLLQGNLDYYLSFTLINLIILLIFCF